MNRTDSEFLDLCTKALDRAWRVKRSTVTLKAEHYNYLARLAWGWGWGWGYNGTPPMHRASMELEFLDEAISNAEFRLALRVKERLLE